MNPRATVVIPTFDHGPTLLRSIPSALSQTVEDIEVFVVGDGAPAETRELVAGLVAADPRIRYFDNPKGEGNGEAHRARALADARGRIVCYLTDDDLWMPDHVELMEELLSEADFAHTLPIRIDPDGTVGHWTVDLEIPWYRERMLGGTNFVPLGCAGHTLDLYRRLPHGWRSSPSGTWSDLWMWQQILAVEGVRARSGTIPTLVHFPSSLRRGWPVERRLEELDRWSERLASPGARTDLRREVADVVTRTAARLQADLADRDERFEVAAVALERGSAWAGDLLDQLEAERRDRLGERQAHSELERRVDAATSELERLRATRTWRLRERLVRMPSLVRLAKAVGAARGRGAIR